MAIGYRHPNHNGSIKCKRALLSYWSIKYSEKALAITGRFGERNGDSAPEAAGVPSSLQLDSIDETEYPPG
jgi:hypothetical protein